MTKKVSIILTSYNHAGYIKKSVESILFQEYNGLIELVVADDSSTDNTPELIRENLKEFRGDVKILETPQNLGISKNYKRAFEACTGDYIFILEGDDYWTDPKRIQKHVEFLENHRECAMTMNRFVWFHEQIPKYIVEPWNREDDFFYINTQEMAEGNKLGNLSACVFRTESLKAINPAVYDMEIADWMLGMAVSEQGLIAILKDVMSVYRIHGQGQWAGLTAASQHEALFNIIDEYNRFFEGRYSQHFEKLKSSLRPVRKSVLRAFKNYLPPIVLSIVKAFLPPAFKKSNIN